MFNIGKLRADAVEYYVGGVAATATDYYVGRGEAAGRWTGSLAPELGLAGAVEETALRRLLAGLDPHSGDLLVSARGSNARARLCQAPDPSAPPSAPAGDTGAALDVAQVAAQLRVSTRAVRHWLAAGERVWAQVQNRTPDTVLSSPDQVRARLDQLAADPTSLKGLPERFLLGGQVGGGRGGGRPRWAITQREVDAVREARRTPNAQAGWDLVFRPPKGFSLLWAVGGDELGREIHAIHTEAVEAALAYLEDSAIAARAARFGRTVRTEAEGLVVAAFDHRESRAGDPLLHSHCVVANVTRRADGRWVTLESRGLYRHGRAADAVYQTTLRHLTERRLGLETDPVINGWADVAGVPREVVEHFSKRSEEIAAELAKIGSESARARELAALATRRAKDRASDEIGLHERWRAEAASVGFGPDAVAACLGRTSGASRSLDETRLEVLFDRLAGPDGLTEHAATFGRAEVICALATALGGTVDGPAVVRLADRFLASPRVCPLSECRPGQRRARILAADGAFLTDVANSAYTTPELVTIEARLLAAVTSAPEAPTPTAATESVAAILAIRPELDIEQRAMVEAVCRSHQGVRLVVGYPGAGKTFAAEACVAALRHSGIPVVGCAVTAEAADELAASTGLGCGGGVCDTLARLLLDLDHPVYGGLPQGAVVVVDEASMVPHRELDRLLAHVGRAGGALVLMGDPKQHGPVGPGGFFAWAVEHCPERTAVLRANHRQRDVLDEHGGVRVSLADERLANLEYRQGLIAASLARRDADGKVVRAASAGELYDTMAADWFVEWQAGARDPMIATRNSVRAELNRRARTLLAAAGQLTGPAVRVAGREFQAGDSVVTRRNDRRLRSPDGTWYVKNSSRGTVVAVDPVGGDLEIDFEGRAGTQHRVRLPGAYVGAGQVEWGYAVTDYGVQGRTLTRSRAVLDDTTRAAGAYVATTRGRLENRIYIVDGTVSEPSDPDTGHGRPAERSSSLERIAAHLAADEADPLVHEIDPWVSHAAPLARRHDLAELRHASEELSRILAAGPPDVSGRLAEEERRQAVLLARRRSLVDRIADAHSGTPHGGPAPDEVLGWERALATIDARLATVATRLEVLRQQDAARQAFVAAHNPVRAGRDVVRHASEQRDITVRLDAADRIPAGLLDDLPLPAEPSSHQQRQTRRRALERVALYRERWADQAGPPGTADPDRPGLWALGDAPQDPRARREWAAAARAITAATECSPPVAPGGAESSPEP